MAKRLLSSMGRGVGYLKAGFLGFQGSGKTMTAIYLAIAVRRHFGLEGPIVMFDSESGGEYINPIVQALTGTNIIGIRSRSFDDLVKASREAVNRKASVFIADSVTHPWRELCEAYLLAVNKKREESDLPVRNNLTLRDWGLLKNRWTTKFSDWYLNSALHVVICGRAGYQFSSKMDEETGTSEMVATKLKMRTESEFGYEPSLLIEMSQLENRDRDPIQVIQRAVVKKDRFNLINGKVGDFVSVDDVAVKGKKQFEEELKVVTDFFKPYLKALTVKRALRVDTDIKTKFNLSKDGLPPAESYKREKTILLEELKGELMARWPRRTVADKQEWAKALKKVFKTVSKTKIENLHNEMLRKGIEVIKKLPKA